MRARLIFLLNSLLAISVSAVEASSFRIFGYLPEWRYEAVNWDVVSRHVSHIILFSLEMTSSGKITARDRFPRKELMGEATTAARRHGSKILLCFGGNGRSAGFSGMVSSRKSRKKFISSLMGYIVKYSLDGVDYNWEYPGYSFSSGYSDTDVVDKDYQGLLSLLKETRAVFDEYSKDATSGRRLEITLAYYPDGRQENLFKTLNAHKYADFMHMMTYDQHGAQHSSYAFAEKSVDQGIEIGLPAAKLTLGVPFYGRDGRGEWTTYEDILHKHSPLKPGVDIVNNIGFNSVETIVKKSIMALEKGIGGLMIWEIGQDCRLKPVPREDTTHQRTCQKDSDSLLVAITKSLEKSKRIKRYRAEDWVNSHTEL